MYIVHVQYIYFVPFCIHVVFVQYVCGCLFFFLCILCYLLQSCFLCIMFSLGFQGAALAISSAFVQISSSIPVLLDEVLCLGDELAISQCHHRDWGVTGYCSHYSDAGVICQGEWDTCTYTLLTAASYLSGQIETNVWLKFYYKVYSVARMYDLVTFLWVLTFLHMYINLTI